MLAVQRWVKPRISLDKTSGTCLPAPDRSFPSMTCDDPGPGARALRRLVAVAREDSRVPRLALAVLMPSNPLEVASPAENAPSEEWSDLAALELVRAARSGERRRFWLALRAARRALEIDPANRRALFNQALAQEQLFLDEAAKDSWRRYIEAEPQAAWRQEATAHLELLSRPTLYDAWPAMASELMTGLSSERLPELSGFVSEVRQLFLGEYLALWGAEPFDDRLCDDSPRWQAIGAAHQDLSGDPLIADIVGWLASALCRPDPPPELRGALARIVEALELYDASQSAASLTLLQEARPHLERSGSPLLPLAELYSAINVFALNRYAEAAARFQELEPQLLSRGFLFLAARAAWLQGTIALRSEDLAGAVEHYHRAQQIFDRGADLSHAAAVRGLIAETLARMGRFEEAWQSGLEGLGEARRLGQPHRLYTSCSLLGIVAALEGAYDLATELQACAAQHVLALGNEAARADVLLWQAAWLHRAGRAEPAGEVLEQARRFVELITDRDERRQATADLALIEGVLVLPREPRWALGRLAAAIGFFDEIGHHYYASDARLLQASAAQRLGDGAQAEESLVAALHLHERFRVGDVNPQSRLATLQGDQSIYDRLVRFQLDEHRDLWRALFFADRGKQDRYSPIPAAADQIEAETAATVAKWRQELAALPPWVTVVSYQMLPDELVTWVLRPGEAPELHRAPPPPPVSSRPSSVRDPAWVELLSAPLRGRVAADGLLVVVADKEINDFPAARLEAGPDGAPVIETAAVLVAPSVDDFLAGHPRRRPGHALASIQAFLAPELAPEAGDLPELRPSRREAAALAENFREVEIWEAGEATSGRFLDSLRRPGVVHFSGHVQVDERQPLDSALLFTADAARHDGRLTARELYGGGRYEATLVSLAGCGSSAAPRSLPLSLTMVRPFLRAGVPAVLGSLRPLPDEVFVAFMTTFYGELGRSGSVFPAFRNTQLRLARSSPPGDLLWAEIQLYAGREVLEMRRH